MINTGWTGGAYGVGSRIKLKYTRAIIDAIHDGSLAKEEYEELPVFGFQFPKKCKDIPAEVMNPKLGWKDPAKYDDELNRLASKFLKNFDQYSGQLSDEVLSGGPRAPQ